jgi:hypothetical protein
MIEKTKVVVVAEWKVSKSKRWKVTGPIRETERDYTNYRVKLSLGYRLRYIFQHLVPSPLHRSHSNIHSEVAPSYIHRSQAHAHMHQARHSYNLLLLRGILPLDTAYSTLGRKRMGLSGYSTDLLPGFNPARGNQG